jgi:hypothetical protein
MAHVIPTLRTTLHTTYSPSQARLKSELPANSVAPARATDFRTVFKSQSNALHTAVSNRRSSAFSPANRSQMFSGSLVRNQDSRATANIPPAGAEGETSSVGSSVSQAQAQQTTTPTATDTTPVPAPAPIFFDGTNIPIQNPFGPNPYLSNPTQNIFANDSTGKMIPQSLADYHFPTQQTAQTVAQLFGGTVFTEAPDPGNPFTLNQPRYMVRLANGTEINPGIISHFYDIRSDTPFQLKQLVQDVLNGGTMCTLQPNTGGYAPAHGAT